MDNTGSERDQASSASQAKRECWCEGMGEEVTRLMRKFGPSEDVQSHFRTARIEFLKGLRAILDERIEKLSATPSRGTSIPVD